MANMRGYEVLVTCPYNMAHQLLPHRVQTHLVKCAKQYPDVKLEICPFNNVHRMKKAEMMEHVKICPDRHNLDEYTMSYGADANKPETKIVVPKPTKNPFETPDEMWDDLESPTYDPQKGIAEKDVLRNNIGMTPAERREFREQERRRLNDIKYFEKR